LHRRHRHRPRRLPRRNPQGRSYRFKKLVGSPLTQIAAAVVLHGARCPTDPAMLYDIDVGKAARNKRPWRIVTEGISASQIPPVLAAQRWRARTQGP